VGEALTGLWRVAQDEPRLVDLRGPLAERARCMAGLAIDAQTRTGDDRVRGAWFRDGSTRMDDQQHAISALLRTVAIVEADSDDGGSGSGSAPSAWLWLAALLAALNPCRLAFGIPREDGNRLRPAAQGGALGAVVVLAVALASIPLVDAMNASDPALRIAAGVVAAVVGLTDMVSRPPAPEPALPGWRGALVPVAVPLVVSPALVVLAISARADRGLGLVGASLAVGIALLVSCAAWLPVDGPGGRIAAWAGRLTAAALTTTSVLLVVDGIFDV